MYLYILSFLFKPFICFALFKGYVSYLCNEFPEVLDDAVEESNSYLKRFIEKQKVKTRPINIDIKDSAELLIGKCDLSQRGYIRLRTLLTNNNVVLPTYNKVREFCTNVTVGEIKKIDCQEICKCMGVKTNLECTLQQIISTKVLFETFEFFPESKQKKIFEFLRGKNESLYGRHDSNKRTIFLRETGDNFRGAARYPTKQTYAILNMKMMLNNPYGQFISTLWRGSESRSMLEIHVQDHYDSLTEAVMNGLSLIVEGKIEHFNVVVFFVADLCFVKDIIGQCQSTSMYGCYHCQLPADKWANKNLPTFTAKKVSEQKRFGEEAKKVLGDEPDRSSVAFKNFQQKRYGQWVIVRFKFSFFFDYLFQG